jgi:hypothetical protein
MTAKCISFVQLLMIPVFLYCQNPDSASTMKMNEEQRTFLRNMIELYDKGIELSDDSIRISKEAQKVLQDAEYRATLYPEVYTWNEAIKFIKEQELKKAFWFFINLYPQNETNKKLVIESVITYDRLLKMDEIMVNTFYTYSMADPEVSIVKDGKTEIIRPDILEAKMRATKEIVSYIIAYRKQQENQVPTE